MKRLPGWLGNSQHIASQFAKTAKIFYFKFFKPVASFFVPVWTWLAPKYIKLYQKMAYIDGKHIPSKGAAAVAYLLGGTVVALYVNFWYIVPFGATFTYDAVAYNVFSYKTEKLYFSSPQWVDGTGTDGDKVLSVFSCNERHCDADSSTEYRFRDSVYLDAVKWVTKFEPYDPADVAGILLSELNYCTATAYGKRFKPLEWYPYVYDLKCELLPPTT